MMYFTPGSSVYVQVQLWCISKTSSAQRMLWGCKTLVAPLSSRAVSPRQEVTRGSAGGKGSPPRCRQPGLCSCKSKRLVPAAAPSVPPSLCQRPGLRSGKFLFACGAKEPWTVPEWIQVQVVLLLQLCSRNLLWLCSPGHLLHSVGPTRCCFTHGRGAAGERGADGFTAQAGSLGRSETQ